MKFLILLILAGAILLIFRFTDKLPERSFQDATRYLQRMVRSKIHDSTKRRTWFYVIEDGNGRTNEWRVAHGHRSRRRPGAPWQYTMVIHSGNGHKKTAFKGSEAERLFLTAGRDRRSR